MEGEPDAVAGGRERIVKQTGTRGAGSLRGPAILPWGGALVLLLMLALAACDAGGSTTSHSNGVALSQLAWCDRPIIEFQDNGTTARATTSKWEKVRDQLGFTVYLPPSLPKGSCLVLAGGTIHDPIYGGHMSITYDVPTSGPVSFSEAPKRANLAGKMQCTQSTSSTASTSTATTASSTSTATTASSTTVCLGTISGTSITIASRQSQADVQALFASLKADVNWVPTDTNELLATATPTHS
jgi:hypothetical protein